MVVVRGGQLVAERYADGFDADTPQLGWSMSKSVTNLLVGRLVQQGEGRPGRRPACARSGPTSAADITSSSCCG